MKLKKKTLKKAMYIFEIQKKKKKKKIKLKVQTQHRTAGVRRALKIVEKNA